MAPLAYTCPEGPALAVCRASSLTIAQGDDFSPPGAGAMGGSSKELGKECLLHRRRWKAEHWAGGSVMLENGCYPGRFPQCLRKEPSHTVETLSPCRRDLYDALRQHSCPFLRAWKTRACPWYSPAHRHSHWVFLELVPCGGYTCLSCSFCFCPTDASFRKLSEYTPGLGSSLWLYYLGPIPRFSAYPALLARGQAS